MFEHVLSLMCVFNYAAVLFMEHWKRRQMRLNYVWDLTGFGEDEQVRGPTDILCVFVCTDNKLNVTRNSNMSVNGKSVFLCMPP